MSQAANSRQLFDAILDYYHNKTINNCSWKELEAITPMCDAAQADADDIFDEDGLVAGHTRIAHTMTQISDALTARRMDHPGIRSVFVDEMRKYEHISGVTDKLLDFVDKK
jgi:hypothetical protein